MNTLRPSNVVMDRSGSTHKEIGAISVETRIFDIDSTAGSEQARVEE